MANYLKGIELIRRDNVALLMSKHNLNRHQLSKKTGIGYSLLGHYIGKNPTKRIGDETARKIENAFNLATYWLDKDRQAVTTNESEVIRDEPSSDVIQRLLTGATDSSKLLSIPYLSARVACGDGRINEDYPEVLGRYEISEDFLAKLNLPSDGKGLILVESDGDSMKPTVPSDTPLLINLREKDYAELVTGKIYAFCADGSMICKRAFRNIDQTITLNSDNPDKETYPDIVVNKDTFNDFQILGRVKFAFVEL